MKKICLIFITFFLSTSALYCQGKLEKAEDDIKSKPNYDNSYEDDNGSNSNFFISAFEGLVVDIVYYSFYALFVESGFETNHPSSTASITKYPYYSSNKGNYSYEWDESTSNYRFTISSRYVYENTRMEGNHFNMDLRFLNRLGLEFNYLQLWENNNNFGDNSLATYTFLAKYNRVRTERFDAYWGIGGTYVDGSVNEWGFAYGLGVEYFIANPISIESNFNQTIINTNYLNKFNALLNYHIKKYKLSAGYEHLKIGNQSFSMLSLGLEIAF